MNWIKQALEALDRIAVAAERQAAAMEAMASMPADQDDQPDPEAPVTVDLAGRPIN